MPERSVPSAVSPLAVVLLVLLGGCGWLQPTAEPTIQLRFMPAGNGCPLAGMPVVTIRIDPAAAEQVTAIDAHGREWLISWEEGFRGGLIHDRVVLDPEGHLAAQNGDVIRVPPQGFPMLHGHSVCAGDQELFVFLQGPG